MLHLAQARKIIESKEPFNISYWEKNGEIVHAENVVCTSSYFRGNTFNLKFLTSEEFRTVKAHLIWNINGEEVFV
ncbi:hypothetical protein [uncultured Sunxiuqinia sp.]|uniref:hypothetical protein n=1 Tax=uncultured Sunxiuqinia sp. TaxID=1573825 RepID=UPI0026119017|nr:hypothetical protein [uncultured Sunxiuqinia sp.]